jgi:hypothetical protein
MATAEWQESALTEKWLEITSCDSSQLLSIPLLARTSKHWMRMETPPRDALINIPVLLRDRAENVQRYGHGDVDIIVIDDTQAFCQAINSR